MANQLYKGDKPLATFIPKIADNLTTDDSTKALSAKQGKVLNEKIEGMAPVVNQLLNIKNVPTTETEYNANWQNYDLIIAEARFYDNVRSTIALSKNYMATTNTGQRPSVTYPVDTNTTIAYDFYTKGTSGKMYIKANNASSSSNIYGIAITGYKF